MQDRGKDHNWFLWQAFATDEIMKTQKNHNRQILNQTHILLWNLDHLYGLRESQQHKHTKHRVMFDPWGWQAQDQNKSETQTHMPIENYATSFRETI